MSRRLGSGLGVEITLCCRCLWSESGGDGVVRATLRHALGSSCGGAVCDFHTRAGHARGGLVPPAGAGQLGERAAGSF